MHIYNSSIILKSDTENLVNNGIARTNAFFMPYQIIQQLKFAYSQPYLGGIQCHAMRISIKCNIINYIQIIHHNKKLVTRLAAFQKFLKHNGGAYLIYHRFVAALLFR